MNIFEFNQEDIKKCVAENKYVLIDFFSSNCWLCHIGLLVFKQVAKNFSDKMIIGKIDIDHANDFQIDLGIKTTPMMVLFKDGFPVVKISGVRPSIQINDKINEFM